MATVGFSTDAKSAVLAATDIVELIGRYVALKRAGKDFVGLCPFHQEKSPSFHVNPARQFFYCYGCKAGGNAIDFVIRHDRVEFKDALIQLAEAANIELPAFGGKKNNTEQQILLEANSAACLFFEKLLSHPTHGRAAREYLAQRGFNEDSISRFRIGLAAPSWDELLGSAAMKRFTPQQIALAGLVKPRDSGGGYYDAFRNRLMFPIRDESGRVIAFGGRVMPGSEDKAKYLNSPETPLFSKSRSIFALDLARTRIVETRTVAVVEGYTDVVMAHQFGVTNVVSVLGTALTQQHVTTLRRLADRIVLLFDPDAAGDAAVNRAVELFLTQPIEIAIASLPEGMDPDEFLLKHGGEKFSAVIAEATDALSYQWTQLNRQVNQAGGLTGQQHAVEQYLNLLAQARGSGPVDALRWGAALSRVSRLTEIPVPELNRRFAARNVAARYPAARQTQASSAVEPKSTAPAPPLAARQRAEGFILGLLLLEPGRWSLMQQTLHPQDFTTPGLREIAEAFWQHQQDEGEPEFHEFLSLLTDSSLKSTAVAWADEASNAADVEASLAGALGFLEDERRRAQERKLIARLRRTSVQSPSSAADSASELDVLRQLQEKARTPDLKRVSS